jgi:hypothetical protein
MAIGFARGFTQPQQQTAQSSVVPVPLRGVDSRVALSGGDTDVCVYAYNLVPSELGLQVRTGYSEFAYGIVDDPTGSPLPGEVRSLIPFTGILSLMTQRAARYPVKCAR